MIKNKSKKIAFICIILALIIFSSTLYSCGAKPEIYRLIDDILHNKIDKLYNFTADLTLIIKKDNLYKEKILIDSGKDLDILPDELDFKIDGKIKENQAEIKLSLDDYETVIYIKDNLLFFELNHLSKIVIDLLSSVGLLDEPVKVLFEEQISYDSGSFIYFDITGFNLKMFDKYGDDLDKIFTVKSTVNYKYYPEDFAINEPDETNRVYFSDIKAKTDKELLKFPNYRYSKLDMVIETDKNNDSFLNILGIRENGEINVLDKFTLDCDASILSKVRDDSGALYTENIFPMRYILELLGENVGWDENSEQAYITKNDKQIYFDGVLFNSTTYINLIQIMGKTDFDVRSAESGEYIEIIIARKK